ncbi:MAG: hypothetical protein KDB40_21985 [Acidimicrobiales bacterium]|nr:hypothetical protein [Acidimicrobiales bacterium]MCB9395598.1 hypothetical protein [Acidimicrobiaceae bacterium]
MSNSRKRLGYVVIGVVVYAVALTVFWAARPLVDDVPVGMDWTPTVQDPPKAQRLVSQEVACSTLFAADARPDEPLPVLVEQPEGRDPLDFQREPCELVQRDARILFGLNVVAVLALLGGAVAVRRRLPRIDEAFTV